jgi:shikimate kinase
MPLASAETLALAGMMGSGKSTVAVLLGRLLGRRVVSLDAAIVRRAGKPVAAIFAEDGEPAFRALERAQVASIPAGAVADLGGGAFCDPENATRLLSVGRVVFLDVSAPEARRRIEAARAPGPAAADPLPDGRPLLDRWERLLGRRLPLYRRAHLTVPVDGLAPEAVARRILEAL